MEDVVLVVNRKAHIIMLTSMIGIFAPVLESGKGVGVAVATVTRAVMSIFSFNLSCTANELS